MTGNQFPFSVSRIPRIFNKRTPKITLKCRANNMIKSNIFHYNFLCFVSSVLDIDLDVSATITMRKNKCKTRNMINRRIQLIDIALWFRTLCNFYLFYYVYLKFLKLLGKFPNSQVVPQILKIFKIPSSIEAPEPYYDKDSQQLSSCFSAAGSLITYT